MVIRAILRACHDISDLPIERRMSGKNRGVFRVGQDPGFQLGKLFIAEIVIEIVADEFERISHAIPQSDYPMESCFRRGSSGGGE
jgi:hypothetical protein